MPRLFARPFIRRLLRITGYIVTVWLVVSILLFVSAIGIGAVANVASNMAPGPLDNLQSVAGDSASANQILALKIEGTIVGDDASPEATGSADETTSGYDVQKALYAAAGQSQIKAVMLEIDSPGGTIYGARAIDQGVNYFRNKTHHPVYAHIEGTGASGAYMAAVAANKIFADYGSDSGDIGVIMGPFQYYDKVTAEGDGQGGTIMTQNGISQTYITAGRSKDLGNPFRPLTPAETATLQQEVNNDYSQFVSLVSSSRHIEASMIVNTIGALPYDNQTASTYHLIDGTMTRVDAFDALAKAAGISESDYQVMEPARQNMGAASGSAITAIGNFLLGRTQPKAATSATCPFQATPLAYSGDVSKLCKN